MPKVLVIDDDIAINDLVKELLEDRGHAVVQAFDGPQGLTKAREAKPDLILLDLEMPMLGGLAVCEMLKADPRTARSKIIILTASENIEHLELAVAAGAAGYVLKPFKEEVLMARIDKALSGARV